MILLTQFKQCLQMNIKRKQYTNSDWRQGHY